MTWHLYGRGNAAGVYLQNVPFFPTNLPADLRWQIHGIWNVTVLATTSATIEYTLDGGVTWFPLDTQPIPANDERVFNIKAADKELFNLRCIDVGGCTIYRVLVSMAPEDLMRPRSDIDVNVSPIPLPVDICPVNCPIDVNIIGGIADPLPVLITGQPITVTWPSALPVDICPVTCDVPIVNGSVTPLDVTIADGPPVGTPVGVTIANETNLVILANTDILGADLTPSGTVAGDSVIFRIEFAALNPGRLSVTLNSTDFVDLNNAVNLKGGAMNLF
ncbi:hypothetical protein KAR91_03675, partial [Candidatus Pacearchaeota archaeon]|nr:hypothetical protein [Candidatus Pacearchaeota archaeon]